MTVKELIEALAHVPDNFEVRFEYDGPETYHEIPARGLIISSSAYCILLTESEENN
jgi:hypothetical protein